MPPTGLEYGVQRSVSRDPTVGSRSNFFHEFPEAVFDGVAWNRYVTPMPSGWGHSTDRIRVPDQKVRISRSDRCIPLKFFSRVSGGCFRWSRVESEDTATTSGRGHSIDRTRVPGQKVCIYRSDRCIPLKFFSGVSGDCFRWSSVESVGHGDEFRSRPYHQHDKRNGLKGPYL